MKTTNEYYYKLMEFKENYPKLLFDNNGYERLPFEIKETHKEQIQEISEILRKTVAGFVEFNNFKPRKDGSFAVRCQTEWSSSFTGVTYLSINDFKEFQLDNESSKL